MTTYKGIQIERQRGRKGRKQRFTGKKITGSFVKSTICRVVLTDEQKRLLTDSDIKLVESPKEVSLPEMKRLIDDHINGHTTRKMKELFNLISE